MYHDEIVGLVKTIEELDSIFTPIEFIPEQFSNEEKHIVDNIAKKYLKNAASDVHHLIPVKVDTGGNCLYYSVDLLMNNPLITPNELRVRTVVELVTNETWYTNMFFHSLGPVDIPVRAVCKNKSLLGLYEVIALCNVLRCNIRSIYPNIDIRDGMAILNSVFTPVPPNIANPSIVLLWSHTNTEIQARTANNVNWSPNHLVPLLSPMFFHKSNSTNQSVLSVTTPQKQAFKNNASARVRIPEFQSSPSRRLRTEANVETNTVEPTIPAIVSDHQTNEQDRRQLQLEKKRERERNRRANLTNEQLEIEREKNRERVQSRRAKLTNKEIETRRTENRERNRSRRSNETDEERQNERIKQRKRSKINHDKKKLQKKNND